MNSIELFLQESAPRGPFGVIIGYPVAQSLSPEMHNLAAKHRNLDFSYYRLEVEPELLPELSHVFRHPNFVGANITVPYKVDIMPLLDDFSDEASAIGAVNTIAVSGGELIGHNTDAHGFLAPLKPHEKRLKGKNALVFGTGGATRAIVYALNQFGIETIWLVARNPYQIEKKDFFASKNIQTASYTRWTHHADEIDLIINATPLGMIPETDSCPVEDKDKDALVGKVVYDIVYKPVETQLLKMAGSMMADRIDGVSMLVNQGARAFELWTGKDFPVQAVENRVRELLRG